MNFGTPQEMIDEEREYEQKIKEEMEDKCKHEWAHGYTVEPIVYCKKCNRDIDEVYKGLPYNEATKIVDYEK